MQFPQRTESGTPPPQWCFGGRGRRLARRGLVPDHRLIDSVRVVIDESLSGSRQWARVAAIGAALVATSYQGEGSAADYFIAGINGPAFAPWWVHW